MRPRYKVYSEAWIFYFNAPFFWCSPFFKNISNPSLEPKIGKQCYLPPLSFKIGLNDTSFHISLNSLGLGFYLSPECLLNFLWLVYSTTCGKLFSIYGVHIPRKCIESTHFYSCPSSPLKTPRRNFWKFASSKTKGLEDTMICFIKIQ